MTAALPTVSKVLAEARSQLRYVETPVNHTKYGRWYGLDGEAWCAIFLSWVFGQVDGLSLIGGKQSYTPTFAAWFQNKGQWGHTPKVGAIVFYAWPGVEGGRISHVGIVEAVNPDGTFITFEGNTTNSTDPYVQRNGGGVCRVQRSRVNVVGFGYPTYPHPVVAKPVAHAEIKLGSKGSDVTTAQKLLNEHGDPQVLVDGDFGPKTQERVKAFQRANKLVADGVIGAKTWAALLKK